MTMTIGHDRDHAVIRELIITIVIIMMVIIMIWPAMEVPCKRLNSCNERWEGEPWSKRRPLRIRHSLIHEDETNDDGNNEDENDDDGGGNDGSEEENLPAHCKRVQGNEDAIVVGVEGSVDHLWHANVHLSQLAMTWTQAS